MSLKPQETDELYRVIEQRHGELIEELRQDVARARDEPYAAVLGGVSDEGDRSVADLIADLENAETARDLTELKELEAARRRIAEQSYGICIDCSDDIPVERLRAYPAAARCITCQSRHERTHRR